MRIGKRWVTTLLLGLSTGVCAQVASYDTTTGVLTLPAVQVGAMTYVDVTLRDIGGLTFALQGATEQSPPGGATNSYDGATGILSIPTVQVVNTSYINVTLRNTGSYTFSLLAATEQTPPAPEGQLAQPVWPINTISRSEVVARWNDTYADDTPFTWSGDVASCNAGDTPESFKRAVLRRLNYYRAMAGLPGNLTLDLALSAKAQQAALMMDAADRLSHFPDTGWPCYRAAGAEAASRSNLALTNSPTSGVAILDGYITDRGANNFFTGHRRWILYSQLASIGSGQAPQSNALWVVGPGTTGPTAPKVAVPWPPQGFIPRPLQSPTDRFSYACASADFGNATVAMRDDIGQSIATKIESRTDNGYGDNTIVWSIDTTASPLNGWDRGTGDTAVTVDITGIANCAAGVTTSYVVTFITP